jgi:hypothetical protein
MVQQGGESHLRVSLGCLTYTVQPAWPALPGPGRPGVRHGLSSSASSLVNGLPSTISFGPPLPAFDRFVGTTPLCHSLLPFMWVLWLIAFSDRSTPYRLRMATGSLGFSRAQRAKALPHNWRANGRRR